MSESDEIRDILRRELKERRIAEEAEEYSGSLVKFVRAAWPQIKPEVQYRHNWHIDAICEHLEAVSRGQIKRLQIWIPPQSCKPVDEEALILMANGSRKRLADVDVGDSVIAHSGCPREVLAVHEQGLLETIRIETESGRVTHAAPDHPFLTPSGWKQAGDLAPGDVLGTVSMPDCQHEDSDRSLEEMRLIGYFIGDGNCTVNPGASAANITCLDLIQGADIVACAEKLGFYARYQEKARRYGLGNGIRAWLREAGLAGHTSWTKRVPEFVFSSPPDHIANFIGAYFACDGTLTNRKGRIEGRPRSDLSVIFNSVNRPLLQDVQHLLLRLGVRSRIRIHRGSYKGQEHISWRLIITSVDDTTKFIDRIPVIGVKAERLSAWGMQRSRFEETLLPDTIISVEPAGLRKCRCLSIATDQTFTADDLVVHNSILASVCWPAWEWTFAPGISYWTASYSTDLSGRLSAMSWLLMKSPWYVERWGSRFKFIRDAEHFFSNDRGGVRLATSPGAETGTGYHGDRILIDDAINAKAADAISKIVLEGASEWYDGTVSSRGIGPDHARVNIQQRLHESDLAAHMLEIEDWVVLALPELYWPTHPYAWRGQRKDIAGSGSTLGRGDPRQAEDELLWPDYRPKTLSEVNMRQLGYRAAGQYQQWPEPREGALLKRAHWRFYDPKLFDETLTKRELEAYRNKRPKLTRIVQSVDTPLKDKESNDHVSIQAWGIKGADRFLIDIRTGHMNYPQAKRAIKEQAAYVRKLYPRIAHTILIENAGYGVELIIDLKRELTGVTKISGGQDGDKIARAEAASSDLESGNCWLPGIGGGPDETLGPAKTVGGEILEFIEELARFPHGSYDDRVDSWSQCMNWSRSRVMMPGRTASPFSRKRRQRASA